jgi:hypothetical protein
MDARNGVRLVEVLGRVRLLEIAHQAFVAAKEMRPAALLTLHRGSQVLREWLPLCDGAPAWRKLGGIFD